MEDKIPSLWTMYDVIFEYLGYRSLQITQTKATLHFLTKNGCNISSNKNNGIRYYDHSNYGMIRRYSDYVKDIRSFIPTNIYYKTNEENKYYKIGDYDKRDWNILTSFSKTKKRLQPNRNKKKKPQNYEMSKVPIFMDNFQFFPIRCPCGCNRKIRGKGKAEIYKRILAEKGCVEDKGKGWRVCGRWSAPRRRYRWRGYKRYKHKTNKSENAWWDFHEKAIKVYQRKYRWSRC